VSRRLATIPITTTTSSPTATTVVAPPPTAPKQLARQDPEPVAIAAEVTTSTTQLAAQEMPKSAYDIITKLDALPVRDEHTLG